MGCDSGVGQSLEYCLFPCGVPSVVRWCGGGAAGVMVWWWCSGGDGAAGVMGAAPHSLGTTSSTHPTTLANGTALKQCLQKRFNCNRFATVQPLNGFLFIFCVLAHTKADKNYVGFDKKKWPAATQSRLKTLFETLPG